MGRNAQIETHEEVGEGNSTSETAQKIWELKTKSYRLV